MKICIYIDLAPWKLNIDGWFKKKNRLDGTIGNEKGTIGI